MIASTVSFLISKWIIPFKRFLLLHLLITFCALLNCKTIAAAVLVWLAVQIKTEKENEYYALGRLPVPITSYPFSRGEMSGAHHIMASGGEVQTIGGRLIQALLVQKAFMEICQAYCGIKNVNLRQLRW